MHKKKNHIVFLSIISLILAFSSCKILHLTTKKTSNKSNEFKDKGGSKNLKNSNKDKSKESLSFNNLKDFDYSFLNDGDAELQESLKKKLKERKKIQNKYSSETDLDQQINEESNKSIKNNIIYSVKKGISMNLDKKTAKFLGESQITQDDISLKAAQILFNWDIKTLIGKGKKKGKKLYAPPIINYKKNYFLTRYTSFNSDSQQAFAKNIISPQKEGIFRAKKFKKITDKYFYIQDGEFTTCRLENPHFMICTNRAKIIEDDRVITNLFYLKFEQFKTPIGFFYSVFKISEKRESGFLFPDVGLNSVKGFYINDYGYFWAINDYIGLSIKSGFDSEYGDIYIKLPLNYTKRYLFSGSINTEWKNEDLRDILMFNWMHNMQQQTWGSFNSSINLKLEFANPEYKSRVKELYENNHMNSDITFNFPNIFSTPYNANISLHHDKKFGRKIDDKIDEIKTLEEKESEKDRNNIIFPNMNLQSSDFYIFRFFNNAPSILANLHANHKFQFKYQKSKIDNFNKFWNDLNENFFNALKRSTKYGNEILDTHYGAINEIPISTNFVLFNNYIITPSFTWKDRWYFDTMDFFYDNNEKRVSIKDIKYGFKRIGEYDFATNIQTNFIFQYNWDPENFLQAFRHTVNPVLGFNFNPGYGSNDLECFQRVYNYYTREIEKKYIYDDIYGVPQDKATAILSFQLKNVIEFKYKDRKDKSKIFQLFKNLDFNVGYDLLAKKYKLQNIKINAVSTFWDNHINLRSQAEIDPYVYKMIDDSPKKLDEYAWNNGKFLGEIRKASFNADINLNPNNEKPLQNIGLNPNRYMKFDILWNMRISYNISYYKESLIDRSKRILEENRIKGIDPYKIYKPHKDIVDHTLHFEGDLNLTQKWKLNFSILYNIKDDKFENPKISFIRDLHCWEMRIDWTPLYYRNSLNFVIKVKADILKSIKYRSRGKL